MKHPACQVIKIRGSRFIGSRSGLCRSSPQRPDLQISHTHKLLHMIMSESYDQVSFLMLCLKHSGKTDFGAVAKELSNVNGQPLTRDAAQKRFTRLKLRLERGPEGSPKKAEGKVKRERDDESGKISVEEKKIKR